MATEWRKKWEPLSAVGQKDAKYFPGSAATRFRYGGIFIEDLL